MTHPTLRFIRRGQIVTLANVPPSRTLLEVLREDLGSTGTKEGCGEGDCGACTVVLGEARDGKVHYSAVNSCIRLAHSIHGMALWTARDLVAEAAFVLVEEAAREPVVPMQRGGSMRTIIFGSVAGIRMSAGRRSTERTTMSG